MPEGQQPAADSAIDYSRLGLGDHIPGVVPLVEVKTPHRVVFGIDALGQWRIEVHAQDGTSLEAARWWTYAVGMGGGRRGGRGAFVERVFDPARIRPLLDADALREQEAVACKAG
ncbi:hypothetical protein [Streptomyces sp. NRRL S-646]|uniref:hypothetical protein n=1 Tax=Streptomyces sp. NRRL S-646 TaxID=1463917 RepID=UPI0004CA66E0|nr:hypothetical protein [Streptomyces sp. NRRL S-646]